jgi:hypothetical protein
LSFISAVATQAVISAVGAQLLLAQIAIAYAVTYSVTYIATGSAKAAQGAGLAAGLFMGIGGLRGGKMGIGAANDRISSSIANHLRHIL